MIVRRTVLGLLATGFVSLPAAAQPAGTSPVHGSLESGPHAVGFRILTLRDSTRFEVPRYRADGTIETADRSRRLDVHVWYPAERSDAPPLSVADYLVAHLVDVTPAARAQQENALRRFLGEFGPVTDPGWADLLRTPLLARRAAPAAAGRHPLIVGQLRPFSTTVTNEYLASHGYVVAMTEAPSPDVQDPGAGLESGVRDMEFAVPALRREPFVDPARLAALGFSGAGFSQILFAMRHPDVDAVCDLESAIFDDRMMWPLSGGWGYDVGALRVPFLHTYSVPLSERENRIGDFERMRYSTRYRYLVDAPGIHHWDFATEGMAASAVLRNRGANGPRLQQAFETTNRYVLAFFDAHVKHDSAALAFLGRAPMANGVPSGLVSMRVLPAIEPAPTVAEFQQMALRDGAAAALRALDDARVRDPEAAAAFTEVQLNRVAYGVLRSGRPDDAIVLFRRVLELNPGSANAHDSLSEALEAIGATAEALAVSRRGLEALAAENLPADRREQLQQLLAERVRRLGGG